MFEPSALWHLLHQGFDLAFPAMQSLMTARINEDAQGELQGAIASMISLTSIIGPVVMTSVFGAYADKIGPYFGDYILDKAENRMPKDNDVVSQKIIITDDMVSAGLAAFRDEAGDDYGPLPDCHSIFVSVFEAMSAVSPSKL